MKVSIFNMVCYLTLIDHHGLGWEDNAHPEYLAEKANLLDTSEEFMYCRLDAENQSRVLKYCKRWKLELPQFLKDHLGISDEAKNG